MYQFKKVFIANILLFLTILLLGCPNLIGFSEHSITINMASEYSLSSISEVYSANEGIFKAEIVPSSSTSVKVTSVSEGDSILIVKGTGSFSEYGNSYEQTILYSISVQQDGSIKKKILSETVPDIPDYSSDYIDYGHSVFLFEAGDDSNTGLTESQAVKTLYRAIELVNTYAEETDSTDYDWHIYVYGTITCNTKINELKPSQLTIQGLYDSGTAILDGGNKDTVLTISTNQNISLQILTIQNGYAEWGYGGAINNNGNLYIGGVSIWENTAKDKGGAIYNNGSITLDAGTIMNNSATEGGAIYSLGSFYMNGGDIVNNTATAEGSGVYINGFFSISGDSYIDSSNDVYLAKDKQITISDSLTHSGTVATITPESYTSGTQILDGFTVSEYYTKFAITPDESGNAWGIDSAGKLQEVQTYSGTSSSINITDSSAPVLIKGNADGSSLKEIYINKDVSLTEDTTYNITLDNVTRTAEQYAGAFTIYNNTPGKTLTVCITLVGENKSVGGNHGGIKLTGASGANINVVFRTESSGSFEFDAQSSSISDLQIENVTVNFYIESGTTFVLGTSGGTNYPDYNSFFNAAQNSKSGSKFSLSTTS